MERIYKIIVAKLYGNLVDKKIAILGFSFKANTNDTRESPSIKLCRNLLLEGANLSIHDPRVNSKQIEKELIFNANFDVQYQDSFNCFSSESSIYEAIDNSDAVIVLTEWDIYKKLDWERISISMRSPSWIFDTRLILDPNQVRKTGLNLWRLGDGNN